MDTTLTAGLSLKPQHYRAALDCAAPGMWFEVHPENYFVEGGPRLAWLDAIRMQHPLSLHSVSLSLGSARAPARARLERLADLVRRIEPAMVSEHLAWSEWGGSYYPDLLPLVRTTEALQQVVSNISCVQEALGRRIAVENPAHYLRIPGHEWDEVDFLCELSRRSGCGLLLDVNNVYVAARNLDYSAEAYIDRFPVAAVLEIHLAGHSLDPALGEGLLIDSHDAAVADPVWALYARLLARAGPRPALIERDAQLPGFDALLAERNALAAMLPQREEEAA